jgi:hypothetical protein
VDVIYSIGVLHHLRVPITGFRALAPLLVPGGLLVAWLYAREGNRRLLTLLEPRRRVTRHAPLGLVRGLAWALTVPLWLALRTVYAGARAWPPLQRSCLYSIVFDQLLAPSCALHVPDGGGAMLHGKRARAGVAALAPREQLERVGICEVFPGGAAAVAGNETAAAASKPPEVAQD